MTTMFDVGNKIAARAVQLCRPEVIAAYPITPQTVIVEDLARMVEAGVREAEFRRGERYRDDQPESDSRPRLEHLC